LYLFPNIDNNNSNRKLTKRNFIDFYHFYPPPSKERDIIQEDRVEAGNTIYKTLMQYTTMGLSIWETSDVAKYNDYVVYNTVSGETPEVATEAIL
jgi:hypothetical protein